MPSPRPAPRRTAFLLAALRLAGRRTVFGLTLGMCASIALSLVELAVTFVIQLFLRVLGLLAQGTPSVSWLSGFRPSAWQLALILLVVGVVRSLATFLVMQSGAIANETMNARLKLLSIHEMLQSKKRQFVPASLVSYRMSEVFPKASQFCYYAATAAALALQCAVLTVLMLLSAWREACTGLVGLGVVGVLMLAISRRVRREASLVPGEQSKLVAGIERVARNWLLVQALRTHDRESAALRRNVVNYTTHSMRANFLSNVGAAVTPLFGIVLLVLMLLLSRLVWQTPGLALLACLYLFVRFTQNLGVLASNVGFLSSYAPQFESAVDYYVQIGREEAAIAMAPAGRISMRLPQAETADTVRATDGTGTEPPPPRIELERVSFVYPGQSRAAIDEVSLSVAPGSQCAIVGPSGSGKSTLLALVLGVLPPSRGAVRVAGHGPAEYFAAESARVGYVGPDPFVIDGTIRDNLAYGCRLAVDDEQRWEALRSANLDDVVVRLADGLDHRITAAGDGLSAGQKQRLALARALMNRPQLLILDEPSANLDDETEAQIAQSILRLKGRATVLVVSHRRGILKFADATVDLEVERRVLRAAD